MITNTISNKITNMITNTITIMNDYIASIDLLVLLWDILNLIFIVLLFQGEGQYED